MNGFLYSATGEKYINEAIRSAKSIKSVMPDSSITIVTDEEIAIDVFDNIIIEENLNDDFSSSNIRSRWSPYNKTIFLDTDTYVCEDINHLFDMLDKYDLLVAYDPKRARIKGLPEPWVEFNSGVIGFRQSDNTKNFFDDWNRTYEIWREKYGWTQNQQSFTKTIYDSNLNLYVLPREYNCRVPTKGYVYTDPKIVHGRHPIGLENVVQEMTSVSGSRLYWPHSYHRSPAMKIRNSRSLRYYFESSLKDDGLLKTGKKAILRTLDLARTKLAK